MTMRRFHHTFRVAAPTAAVARFHQTAANMAAITPPPILVQLHSAPAQMGEGDQMEFTLWIGPLPVRWVSRFEKVTSAGFVDRQLQGPFRHWVHTHRFVALDAQTTEVRDTVEALPRRSLFWRLIGLAMWQGLPLLFAYRSRQTRRILDRHPGEAQP